MAFLAAAAPYITAGAAAYGEVKKSQAAEYNSKVETIEGNQAVNQANAQEGIVRRGSREQMGKQIAAFGAAGAGYGGSVAGALDQSSVNSELDALNTRYKGQTTAYGYRVQSGIDKGEAKDYGLTAGAALLKGFGSNYTYTKQPTTAENGVGVTS